MKKMKSLPVAVCSLDVFLVLVTVPTLILRNISQRLSTRGAHWRLGLLSRLCRLHHRLGTGRFCLVSSGFEYDVVPCRLDVFPSDFLRFTFFRLQNQVHAHFSNYESDVLDVSYAVSLAVDYLHAYQTV